MFTGLTWLLFLLRHANQAIRLGYCVDSISVVTIAYCFPFFHSKSKRMGIQWASTLPCEHMCVCVGSNCMLKGGRDMGSSVFNCASTCCFQKNEEKKRILAAHFPRKSIYIIDDKGMCYLLNQGVGLMFCRVVRGRCVFMSLCLY